MWIFSKHGFASATQSPIEPAKMQIRFRVEEHLEAFREQYQLKGKTVKKPGTDYPFRVITTVENFVLVVSSIAVEASEYRNFKGAAVTSGQRSVREYEDALHDVWATMGRLQAEVEGFGPYGRRAPWKPIRPVDEYIGALTPDNQFGFDHFDDDVDDEPVEPTRDFCEYCLCEADFTCLVGGINYHVCKQCAEDFFDVAHNS